MQPEWVPLRQFENYPPWARAIALLATNIIAAVVLTQWIESFGILGYSLVLGAVFILSFLVLFIKPKTSPILIHNEKKEAEDPGTREAVKQPKPEKEKIEEVTQEQKEQAKMEKSLHNLTKEEKEFVAPYIFQDLTSQYVDVMSGIYRSLRSKNIVGSFASIGYMTYRDVLLQDWAREYLKDHPDLLKGFENTQPRHKPNWH